MPHARSDSRQSIAATQREFATAFAGAVEPMTRYALLISLAKRLPASPPGLLTDTHLIPGCESRTWLVDESDSARLRFFATSEAMLVRGALVVLFNTYSDRNFSEVARHPIAPFFTRIGLALELTPSRQTGFLAVARHIESFAAARTKMQRKSG